MEPTVIFQASLRVSGKFLNPEAVTKALLIDPVSSAKTGATIGTAKHNYKVESSFWFGEVYRIPYQQDNPFKVPDIISQGLIKQLSIVGNIDEINLCFLINGNSGDAADFIREYGREIENLVKQEAQFAPVHLDIPTLGFDEIVEFDKQVSLQNLVNY